jgi:hypothetical protein
MKNWKKGNWEWGYTNTKTQNNVIIVKLFKWYVIIVDKEGYNINGQGKAFNKKSQAIKYANSWMKKHINK